MANKLGATARNWAAQKVACRFTATADGKPLPTAAPTKPAYKIPPGTTNVIVTAAPVGTDALVYWPTTITLSVSSGGVISPKPLSVSIGGIVFPKPSALVDVTAAAGLTKVSIKMSRFKEVTTKVSITISRLKGVTTTVAVSKTSGTVPVGTELSQDGVLGLLQTIPARPSFAAPPASELIGTYGAWPPKDWTVKPAPDAHYIDVRAPVKADSLNFAKDAKLNVDVESVVLELAADKQLAPRLFGVAWPNAIAPKDGAHPTPILLFLRQTGQQDSDNGLGVFTGGGVKDQPYPYNFDYVERCLFESLHYGKTPLVKPFGHSLRPKGVPYQVAKSGANVVTVFPVAAVPDKIGYGVLADMQKTENILKELQAFMFWRAGIQTPPTSLGNTAIAAFSSATGPLAEWLADPKNRDPRTSSFFKNTVRAIYFLDPPKPNNCVTPAVDWAHWAGSDTRIRLYSRMSPDDPRAAAAFRKLLGLKPRAPLPPPPFVQTDNRRTVASFYLDIPKKNNNDEYVAVWVNTFQNILNMKWGVGAKWWDAHHFIAATMLTHALAQDTHQP